MKILLIKTRYSTTKTIFYPTVTNLILTIYQFVSFN